MDGNGRWAKQRLRPRVWGHIRGSNRVNEIVTTASKLRLDSLTLYAFSTENWSRPTEEVNTLFKILKKFLKKERNTLLKNNIKFDVIGNYKALDTAVVNLIEELKEVTLNNTGLKLNIAVNYGGRAEIVDAVNKLIVSNPNLKEITEDDLSQSLYNPSIPNIDLLIRTAGEKRVSNFLLWQMSYSEFFFTETKWPDFRAEEFVSIIDSVSERERRFGSLESSGSVKTIKEKINKLVN